MADSRWKNFVKRLNPYMIKKGVLYLKHFGFKEFMVRLSDRIEPEEVPYGNRYTYRGFPEELNGRESILCPGGAADQHRGAAVSHAGDVPERDDPVGERPDLPDWELCLADGSPEDEEMNRILREFVREDPRIRVRRMRENQGIVGNTNAAPCHGKRGVRGLSGP